MLIGHGSQKTKFNRYIRISLILLAWILILCSGVHTYKVVAQSKESIQIAKSEVPLLLNSGLVEGKEAEVTLILWFEDSDIPSAIRANKPTPDWIWAYKELQLECGKVSATLTGQRLLNKNEERNLFAWYTTMVPQINKAGGRIYLDERIPQVIDTSAYLSQTNALPTQWVLIDNMVSIAAYHNNLEMSVMAGQDRINMQLLSRGNNTGGQSVLAIPVLLKQF